MKLIWTAVPVLIAAAALAGCSSDDSKADVASASSVPASSTPTVNDHGDDDERGGAVRVPLGETGKVLVPADAVMDIKVPEGWGAAAGALRCTATDRDGGSVELRAPEVNSPEQVRETTWTTLRTFSAPANAEITVGCQDPESKISADSSATFIRVVPRGLTLG